jgi:hypothetical protein
MPAHWDVSLTGSHAAAQRIGVFTIDFPDPSAINYDNNKFTTLNDSVSFTYHLPSNVQTLSTKGVDGGTDPYGILYVPDLYTDGCKSEEAEHVPANATRLADLPAGKNYALIAVAPWYSPQCMIEYFTAARRVTTKAIFVYQPGQSNAKPPVLNDPSWDLQDGGGWQRANTFPTYALSSMTGGVIMQQLSQYSGNLTNVPHGAQLAQDYDHTDYIRLWASVDTDIGAQLPSLWVFLVIVLAALLVVISTSSVAMHIIQRRRRNDLRRRVLEGQVDLEVLGVKRLHVSQQVLDKLPLYTYSSAVATDPEKADPAPPAQALGLPSSSVDSETGVKMSPLVRHSSAPTTTNGLFSSSSQPTCPICLDDFEDNETQVRELPCRHIYHPDCIDTFLLRNSSLCPMCKQSVLPPGVCPVNITNIMVRRERHINRMRVRSGQPTSAQLSTTQPSTSDFHPLPRSLRTGTLGSLGSRIGGAMAGRRIFSAPERTRTRPSDIEMASTTNDPQIPVTSAGQSQPVDASAAPSVQRDCAPTHNRREWARQRALALLGDRHTPNDSEEEESGSRPRRLLRKVFPGFR